MKYRTTDKHPNGSGLIIEYSEDMKMYRSPQGSNYTPGEISAMNDLGWFERVEEERIRIDRLLWSSDKTEVQFVFTGIPDQNEVINSVNAAINNDPREGWTVDQMRDLIPHVVDDYLNSPDEGAIIRFLDHLETLKPEKTKWVWEGGESLAVAPDILAKALKYDRTASGLQTKEEVPASNKPRTYSEAEVLEFGQEVYAKAVHQFTEETVDTVCVVGWFTEWSGQEPEARSSVLMLSAMEYVNSLNLSHHEDKKERLDIIHSFIEWHEKGKEREPAEVFTREDIWNHWRGPRGKFKDGSGEWNIPYFINNLIESRNK